MSRFEDLNTNMNTDDLCEVYSDFLFYHGLEHLGDMGADELLYHLEQDLAPCTDNQMTTWLKKFIACWIMACDEEFSIGHALESMHGWKREQYEGFEHDGVWITDHTKSPCGRFDLTPEQSKATYGNKKVYGKGE